VGREVHVDDVLTTSGQDDEVLLGDLAPVPVSIVMYLDEVFFGYLVGEILHDAWAEDNPLILFIDMVVSTFEYVVDPLLAHRHVFGERAMGSIEDEAWLWALIGREVEVANELGLETFARNFAIAVARIAQPKAAAGFPVLVLINLLFLWSCGASARRRETTGTDNSRFPTQGFHIIVGSF
jgi:hypothetical protein